MIEALFIGVIVIYGLIYLRGFVKVFNIGDLSEFKSSTNKVQGILWLVCSVFLILTAILLIMKSDWWWTTAIFSIIFSQILIIKIGKYTKVGTAKPTEWVATVKEYENMNGINIPTKLEISWNLDTGIVTWYKI